ncbi:MAG: SsgA family sporulation/cell division regulator [Frankiaceae bacterium]|nr:SsgA family sporulation/cell division regulator [Frankiaceae bacterium]
MVQDEVAAEVVLDDGRLTGRGLTTVLRLAWRSDDPLAVVLTLTAEPDHPSLPQGEWVILRDFLRYGLDAPTGDGDVRFRPDDQLGRVWFELERPGRAACVSVPKELVLDFLDRTDAVIPAGEERSDETIDALLARLLASE